ncbi:hypothetical protein ACAW74_08620 [Fibrella sp. WM1]|uniref:hypothetical protein n=1 Tax=Fibrella musci TaxID=3242485 RepID=UPI0035204F40
MTIIKQGNLQGQFSGFRNRETVFVFSDGERWQQDEYRYVDHSVYRPQATVSQEGGAYYLHVAGVAEKVRVVKRY